MTDLETFATYTTEHGGQWYKLEPGLYKSQMWHMADGRNSHGDNPVYQVFVDGKRICATLSYQEALEVWRGNETAEGNQA